MAGSTRPLEIDLPGICHGNVGRACQTGLWDGAWEGRIGSTAAPSMQSLFIQDLACRVGEFGSKPSKFLCSKLLKPHRRLPGMCVCVCEHHQLACALRSNLIKFSNFLSAMARALLLLPLLALATAAGGLGAAQARPVG